MRMRYKTLSWLLQGSLLLMTISVLAAEQKEAELNELLQMDLRQLMNIDISLASRIDERQFNAPAAVYVLTQEDIRRSGHRRLPEILRMVPGLHVAKLDANKWAVSSRTDLSRYSSTMLVMIDGRHVYTPFFAGVYWEIQDSFIEDIERIEVVRGPGASIWGANAVDGIINIITKSAADTHGVKAYALAGSGEMKNDAGIRFGAKTANEIDVRVFARSYKTDSGEYLGSDVSNNSDPALVGSDANDDGNAQTVGFRMDWSNERDRYMVQGNMFNTKFNEERALAGVAVPNEIESSGYNMVFNWKRTLANNDSLAFNASYDDLRRDDDILHNDEATFDFDFQHNLVRGAHTLAWGLGYRNYDNQALETYPASCGGATPCFAVDPARRDLSTWSLFIQDRMQLSQGFALIIGSKFEDNEYTGFEYQPTLRGLWTPDNDSTYWAAATRAVRVPDRVSTDGILDFGGGTTVSIGNPNQEAYIAYTYELGLRKRLSNTVIVDATTFYTDWRNTLQASSSSGIDNVYGFEGYIKYQATEQWRTEFGYAYHVGEDVLAIGGDRPRAFIPKHSINFRSYYNLKQNMDLDAMIYYVGESKSVSGTSNVPAYTRVDLRYGWRPSKVLDVSLLLTNMLDDVHAEARDATKINTGVKRGAMLKLTYTDR